jgi:uncharacterized protein with PIN domain
MSGLDVPAAAGPAFAVDKMLGRLARWLHILGHDVAYGPHLSGRTLAERARREHRLLLTRDTRLLRDPHLPPHLFITSDHFREQLQQVAAVARLGAGFLRRCLDCNCSLVEVGRDVVKASVPPYVLATQDRFERCPRCARVYWQATHRRHMLDELAALGLTAAVGAAE